VKDGCVGEELGDNEGEEADHGQPPIPSLCLGCEGAEAASICGLAIHNGYQGCVCEQLNSSYEVNKPS